MNIGTLRKSPEFEARRLQKLREFMASGKRKKRDPKELADTLKKMAEGRDRMTPEVRKAAALKTALALTGREGTGKGVKGKANIHSVWWAFKSPQNVVISGINLVELIDSNSHLFLASDLKRRITNDRSSTLAYQGLRSLFKSRRAPRSWRGWTAVAQCKASDLDSQKLFLKTAKI